MLVDQHAALEHVERVERVRLRDRHADGDGELRVAIQNMLFPVMLDATPSQLALVARVGDLMSQVEPFGKAISLSRRFRPAFVTAGAASSIVAA